MSKRNIKLVTHHNTYTEVGGSFSSEKGQQKNNNSSFGKGLLRLVGRFIMRLMNHVSYGFGLCLIYPFVVLSRLGKHTHGHLLREIENTGQSLAGKWQQLLSRQFALAMAIFITLSVGATSLFHVAFLYAKGAYIKGQVLGQTTIALNHIKRGGQYLQDEKTTAAQTEFALALAGFQKSESEIAKAGLLMNTVLKFVPAKQDADRLLRAGALLSQAAINFSTTYSLAGNLRITPEGLRGPAADNNLLPTLHEKLTGGIAQTRQAQKLLNEVNEDSLPQNLRGQFLGARDTLEKTIRSLETLEDITKIATILLRGDQHILLLFQNNNELRASGGFIGTFGALDMHDTQISKLHVSSIYDLDGQLSLQDEKIIPPYPLFNVNDQWFLRDSNWFTDFRESAQAISRFYQKAGGKTPDSIIAITPNIITDLLAVTGPIVMPKYNITLDSDNFVELTQVATSVYYDRLENKPKQMLADFMNEFMKILSELEGEKLMVAFASLEHNLRNKNILLYSTNKEAEKLLTAFNWAGAVTPTSRDFLLISSSNLSGSKTDLYLTTKIALQTTISEQGRVINTLTITRANPLPALEKMTNTSFLRILVPPGSKLLANQGFSPIDLDTKYSAEGTIDPQVKEWESNSVKDLSTGTLIGKEAGKTFFGNWLTVRGGETKTVSLSYALPFSLEATDNHSILIQKQPGALAMPVTYSVMHEGRSLYWTNVAEVIKQGDKLTTNTSLERDVFMGFVFEKN